MRFHPKTWFKSGQDEPLDENYYYDCYEMQDVYLVKINHKLWFKSKQGIPSHTSNPHDADTFESHQQAYDTARYTGGRIIRKATVIHLMEMYEP